MLLRPGWARLAPGRGALSPREGRQRRYPCAARLEFQPVPQSGPVSQREGRAGVLAV
jgi:hypothetical protein